MPWRKSLEGSISRMFILVVSYCQFVLRYYLGTRIFPDVLLNDIAGPDGNSLLLSLKLSVDVLVSLTEPLARTLQP